MADVAPGHAGHDPVEVAAFIDDPEGATDALRARIAGCPGCSALAADLRLLAVATAGLPAPSRPRDFRIAPAEAARLAPADIRPQEPAARALRHGYEMTTPAPDHASHDPLLIAADLDGTLEARDAVTVRDWLAGCSACMALRADLADLATATRSMPTPTRPRDFRLTQADADRAAVGGWRRAIAAFGSSRGGFTRPLAVGLTTLGLAGLIVANIPATSLFGATGAADSLTAPTLGVSRPVTGAGSGASVPEAADAAASPRSSAFGAEAVPGPSAGQAAPVEPRATGVPDVGIVQPSSGDTGAAASSGGTGASVTSGGAETGRGSAKDATLGQARPTAADTGPSVLVVVSVVLLVAGLGLALLRWGARRLGDG